MSVDVENSIRNFFSAVQIGKLYPMEHPQSQAAVEKAYDGLKQVLMDRTEIIIGIVDEEVVCGEDIFFGLSQRLKSSIIYLLDRNIERVIIHKAFQLEELVKFISILSTSKTELRKDPQRYLSLQGLKNIRTGKLKLHSLLGRDQADDWVKLRKMYQTSVDVYSGAIGKVLGGEELDHLDIRFNMLNIMEFFSGRHQELINLVTVKRKDLLTFAHLLNVSILAMQFSSKLGFTKDDVLDIGVAALFHDVGKIQISSQILKKETKLTDTEFRKIQDHPIIGMNILNAYADTLGILPAVVAFEHHLRYDMQGYPKVPYPKPPHHTSLIVSLCDVYDALAQKRTYKKDYPPDKIYQVMQAERGTLFDPDLLDRFFEVLGVWPIGSIVSLSDESVAIVREVNELEIFQPKVEVVIPQDKRRFVDLSLSKTGLEIQKALNPFDEGKKYLKYVEHTR
jgi:HD-GYP domain-containing protein (c-di-GMP phosphodiesterase class II)